MISATFIDRPRLAIVISIVITLAGLIALKALPVAQFPDIVPPVVQVSGFYPGAGAEVVEQTVAQPIESQVVGVDNMLYMKSTSGNDGSYSLNVTFAVGTDPDINTVNVQNRVSLAEPKLPEEVRRQGLTVKKKSPAILQVIAFYSPDKSLDNLFLANYATINLLDNIKRIRGVGDAALFGALDYSMRVWLDTNRLTNLGLTPNDVINAIKGQNIQAAVGRIGSQPMTSDQLFQLNIQTQGRLVDVDEFKTIVVRANPDGSFVRIGDIGRVELGAKSQDSYMRFNEGPAALIGVYLAPGANALDVADAVSAYIAKAAQAFPPGLAYKVTFDTTLFVEQSISEVVHTLLEAFVLVVIVVYLFLGNLRATLIPLIAVPVSLIGTFAVMLALGFSANMVSLLALVLAIGIVVDDAIVVVENVEKNMADHPELSPAQAAKKAMGEITAPIVAITLVLLSVFVPVAWPALPAVRRGGVGVHGDLGDQRPDAVSCPVRRLPQAPPRTAPGTDALRAWHHRPRDQWLRRCHQDPGAARGALAGRARCGLRRGRLAVQGDSDRLPARRGPGGVLRRGATAGRLVGEPHLGRGSKGRAGPAFHARRGGRQHRRRLQLARFAEQVQRRVFRRRAQALRGAHRPVGVGPRHPGAAARRVPRLPRRQRLRLQPAADHRAWNGRRLRVPA